MELFKGDVEFAADLAGALVLAQHLLDGALGQPRKKLHDIVYCERRKKGAHVLPSGNSVGSGALTGGAALGSIHRAGTGISAGLPRNHLK